MALLMVIQTQERKIWFAVGFALTFVKIFQVVRYPFVYAFDSIADTLDERRYQRQARKYQRQREQDNWDYQEERTSDRRGGGNGNGWSFEEELARRAEEMRNYRRKTGQGEEREQEQKTNQNRRAGGHDQEREKIEDKRKKQQHQERTETKTEREPRSYEEILGLQQGWTQDDLKKAYQRECQRLHPDRWVGKPQNIREAMEEEYKKVQEAYRKLKK